MNDKLDNLSSSTALV